jgi:CHAT domain-containing protein
LTSVLQHKGRVLDAVSDNFARLRRSVTPTDQALLEQLADVAGQLSSLTYGQDGNLSPEQYRRRMTQLAARKEALETDLAARSAAFNREIAPVTLASVKQAVPINAALVEWFRYTPLDPARKSHQARRGSARYAAYVLKRNAQPVAIDVGPAHGVEALVRRLRVALSNPASSDVRQHSKALSEKLLDPLRLHLGGVEHLLFSPDGELNLVPMAALVDESGAYLAERFDVSYLTSGRDLLHIAREPAALSAVVIADPDYGKLGAAAPRTASTLQSKRSLELDRGGLTVRPIASTALEAQDIRALLKLDTDSVLLRQDASESRLKQLKGPRILHIASHGFFLSDQTIGPASSRSAIGARCLQCPVVSLPSACRRPRSLKLQRSSTRPGRSLRGIVPCQ